MISKEELKDFWERNKEYRESAMMEKLELLSRQADMLKQDVEKWKVDMTDGRLTKGKAFGYIAEEMKSYTQRFDIDRLKEISNQWNIAQTVIENIKRLEEREDKQ